MEGRYYDGKSAAAVAARLARDGAFLLLTTEHGSESIPVARARVGGKLGRLARTVDLPHGGRFESDDHAGMDALFPGRHFVARLEASWRTAVLATGIFAAVLALCYFVVLPLSAERLSRYVPLAWKKKISRETVSLLDKAYLNTSALKGEARARAERVFIDAKQEEPGVNILLRKSDAFGPNAFALPDGTIFVTDALAELAESDEELLGVLFHEAAHVRLNHTTANMIANSVLGLIVFTVVGGDGTSLPLLLLGSSYSRSYEEEADAYAAKKLRARGQDPKVLGQILSRMDKEKEKYAKYFSFLSSHPATAARVKKLSTF